MKEEDIMNPEFNSQALQEMMKDFKDNIDNNEYVAMIKLMKEQKNKEEKVLN